MANINNKDIFQTGYFKQASLLVLLVTGTMTFLYLYEKNNYTPGFFFILGYTALTVFISTFAYTIFIEMVKEKVSISFIEFNKITQEQAKLSLDNLKSTHSNIITTSVLYGVISSLFNDVSFFEALFYNTALNGGLTFLFLESINKNAFINNKIPDGCCAACLFGGLVAFLVSYVIAIFTF